MPEVKLPLYKELAKKILSQITDKEKDTTVSDEDVENTILDIRKSRAPKTHMAEAEPHVHIEGEEHDHEEHKNEEIKIEDLPVFDDEFVQALGPFENVEDFKEKLKINIKLEKENQAKEKARLKIIEKIIDESEIDMPSVLVEIEIDKILFRMESDITQMGLKFEDYLKHLNKTVEDIRGEFRKDGEKKAKLGLVLNEISKLEKIVPDEEQVSKEVEHILEHYKDADRERATLHAQNVLTNEKVFEFLEKQS
jgi:FKBP-type peptidyl-prolyl cis-trans isomerase (trigger factor)